MDRDRNVRPLNLSGAFAARIFRIDAPTHTVLNGD